MSILTKYGHLLARTIVKRSPYMVVLADCLVDSLFTMILADCLVDSLVSLTATRSSKNLADHHAGARFRDLVV